MTAYFREAKRSDLEQLVHLLADDSLGKQREDVSQPLNQRYIDAFEAIMMDANNHLLIAVVKERIVGMLQLTLTPYLTHIGSWRCTVEGVRIHPECRGMGLGNEMLERAIVLAKEKGCSLIQLTTDKQRPEAMRFYQRLGFNASHQGMKLHL
ncbi:GNAT family N-acetyltransferase [Vibrio profundum]|uniref:GNAT family N-acetyltransferase n=1 Tax=Vibrio profundum TaxID=2910247 RepID=UPI003D0A546F